MHDTKHLTTISRRDLLNFAGTGAATVALASLINIPFVEAQNMPNGADNFYTSDKVDLQKVSFETPEHRRTGLPRRERRALRSPPRTRSMLCCRV